ncbi:hypothetical protein [Streptomyces formicae]|uniref:Uncharacterized protein n=1 Tax=Streptomyces formicae TaxID=1616117 RepID=A0A291Q445_9ACTN|nr:hypothetical protein [Streptomyces formicae]ATL26275.1 hypothetical protein KY5_1257 [Streptomyces formicae]
MNEFPGSIINEARSAVHSGEGAQYNFYVQAAASRLREQASRRPLVIARADREHLYRRFVPPPRLQQARQLLHDSCAVLLDGIPGSGRRTAALMLLHELPDASGSFHELPDTSDDTTASPLDVHDIHHGDRLLLDLSEVDESRYLGIQEEFSDFRSHLARKSAHLAMVLPHHLSYLLRGELRPLTVGMGRPSPKRLFIRHLRCENISPREDELNGPDLTAHLARAPMRDVAALADRIRRCRDTAGADQGFPHWLAESLAGAADHTARVAADISAEQNGRRKALLLSLAVFHGTLPSAILQATNGLLTVLGHPPDTTPRLEHSDLHAELTAIGAETLPDGRVQFRLQGYDQAVRNHFWTFLPDIRCQLRDWFSTCLTQTGADQSERSAAVARYAEQGLRTHRPEDLTWLAKQWTLSTARADLLPDASQVLALGLADDQHGRFFRQQIYDWSKDTTTSPGLRRVLILVCSEAMARSHPDQALVRLHHLARRSSGTLGADARQAVVGLARTDNRLYRRMLDRLATGIAQGHWATDVDLFLTLADPVRLIRSPSVRDSLALGWTGVLNRPADYWTTRTVGWLNACSDGRYRDPALDVLVAASATDVRASGRLYRVALDWSRADTGDTSRREETVSDLLRKINAAQGITPYSHAV